MYKNVLLHYKSATTCTHARMHACTDARTHARMHTHTHTHTTILRPSWILSVTTQVSHHQKGETKLHLLEQVIVSGSGISWAICKSAPRPRQITMPEPHHSVFYRPDALPAAHPTASKQWCHYTATEATVEWCGTTHIQITKYSKTKPCSKIIQSHSCWFVVINCVHFCF